jgi:hypothetical protein
MMKNRMALRAVLIMCLALAQAAWGQWSSDPSKNLALSDKVNNDQVQPKLKSLPNGQWYVSWFDADPNTPPFGYDVYVQSLTSGGVERFRHDGLMVANLSDSSTQDYGLDVDTNGNALIAFLDTREGSNEQVTAAKIARWGTRLWGHLGVQLTNDSSFHGAPKIAAAADGGAFVAWISDSNTVVQKLDRHGAPQWGTGIVIGESGYNDWLADLHASDDGSVIISWVRAQGFGSDRQLRANKISASGDLLWGAKNVTLFDVGSLQFGNFPYFIPDGNGGAVFAWYTSRPSLQVFAQHIRADGKEAFPHNGSAGSTDNFTVHVEPSVAYRAETDESFLFWTEEDSLQFVNGVSGQKFEPHGGKRWGKLGRIIIPLGNDSQTFVKTVQVGTGAWVFWVDSPAYGKDTIRAARLSGKGQLLCQPFVVSSTPSNKWGLWATTAPFGKTALAWTDDRIGNNSIYIQNVNPDCSLGQE